MKKLLCGVALLLLIALLPIHTLAAALPTRSVGNDIPKLTDYLSTWSCSPLSGKVLVYPNAKIFSYNATTPYADEELSAFLNALESDYGFSPVDAGTGNKKGIQNQTFYRYAFDGAEAITKSPGSLLGHDCDWTNGGEADYQLELWTSRSENNTHFALIVAHGLHYADENPFVTVPDLKLYLADWNGVPYDPLGHGPDSSFSSNYTYRADSPIPEVELQSFLEALTLNYGFSLADHGIFLDESFRGEELYWFSYDRDPDVEGIQFSVNTSFDDQFVQYDDGSFDTPFHLEVDVDRKRNYITLSLSRDLYYAADDDFR